MYISKEVLQSLFKTKEVPGEWLVVYAPSRWVYNHLAMQNKKGNCDCSVILEDKTVSPWQTSNQ